MDTLTKNKLKMLEAQHTRDGIKKRPRLKVYYGFSKINKIQKREAIQVTFENEAGAGSDTSRSGKQLRKQMDIVTERGQTEQETADASMYTRVFTTYYIFLDDKKIGNSFATLQVEAARLTKTMYARNIGKTSWKGLNVPTSQLI